MHFKERECGEFRKEYKGCRWPCPSVAAPLLQEQGNTGAQPLHDVVDVTMEVSAGTPGNAQAVRDQLAALITGGTYLDVSILSHFVGCRCDNNWLPLMCGRCSAWAKAQVLGCCR